MKIASFNLKFDVPLVQLQKCGHFQAHDAVQRTRWLFPSFFAGKKGWWWISEDRTLAWWPGQLGHSDQRRPRKAWSNWLGAGEYQELAQISLLGLDSADLKKMPHAHQAEGTYKVLLLHFERKLTTQQRFIGCFGTDQQINKNYNFFFPKSSKQNSHSQLNDPSH